MTYRRKMPKPPAHVAQRLSLHTMSDRQAARLAAGLSLESKPSDYANDSTADERRRRDARRELENRKDERERDVWP